MEKAPIIAAIDVGTNSFHMVIAIVNEKGVLNIISREKEMVRLGSSGKDMKYLQEDAINRGLETIYRFSKIAESHNAIIRAVATSAVREALNKDDFTKKVKNEIGVEIEVVSGIEEGRLIYLGVIHALPLYQNKSLVIDIGGGSTETIIGTGEIIDFVNSEKIGAIRLTKQFCESGIYTKETVAEIREFILGEWSPILNQIKDIGFNKVVGTSGTIVSLSTMALLRNKQAIPDLLNGYTLPAKDILEVIKQITKARNVDEIAKIPGVDPKRSDILLAGSLILEVFLKELEIKEISISPYALREGIVFDTYEKLRSIEELHHLTTLRFETIKNLAIRYGIYNAHAKQIVEFSLKLFDKLSNHHRLGEYEREILECAALLHDIGYWISHDQHHKHSYYIITHSDLPGFTNDEAELIANIARFHRKSLPKKKHIEFSKLNNTQQYIVKVLSGILRIAEGIDRRQKQYVQDLIINENNNEIEIKLLPDNIKVDIDIEIWGAKRRKELLEEVLNLPITIL
jgi:exopolyphosphatase/guanosine-5'-triphosphate,3'-diphosphate pyrophosphatase